VPMAEDVATWMPSIYKSNTQDPVMMYLYGVGDHGGGPTRTMLDQATRLMRPEAVYPKVEFSTAAAFFADIDKRKDLEIPTWNGELYFQYHRGVFTTQAETKRRIRHAEETLLDAEKFASLAALYTLPYPKDQFTASWKGLLFDQFHDIMPGSGIAVNYLDAKRDLEAVERSGNEILQNSLDKISAQIDTRQRGVPIVVYNSLSWQREEIVAVEVDLPESVPSLEVEDSSGKAVLSQVLEQNDRHIKFLMQATVPALGYATFFVTAAQSKPQPASSLHASPDSMENEFVRLKIDPQSGCITSLYDKQSQRETLAPAGTDTGGPKNSVCGNLLQTFVDKPKEYDAWNIDADFEDHYWSLDKADEVKLVESGPLRAVIRVKQHFQSSSFTRDITLYPGATRVDVKMAADWQEKHILLKVAFPISAHSRTATYEIPFGSVERPTTRSTPEEKAQFEVPAEYWADLSDSDHGLSVLNDSKYGYDAKGNVLRLTLLRSPTWPDPHADEGLHEFTYSLYPHGGTWKDAETVRRGYELNYPLLVAQGESHSGGLPPVHSFVEVNADNVVLPALKNAEVDNAVVLRFYEWAGKESDIDIQLPQGAQSAVETNLIEHAGNRLPMQNGHLTVHTKPFEIKTVAVQFTRPQ